MIIAEGRVLLRWTDTVHIPDLVDLYEYCFPKEEWRAEDFRRFAVNEDRSNVSKVILGDGDQVLGSLLYTLEPATCRIRRVAVWPEYRGKGLATFAVNSLIGPRSPIRRTQFSVRVKRDNRSGELFFRQKLGFKFSSDAEPGADYHELVFSR